MRKMLFLVVMLPFFAMVGCSGGGADPTAGVDGGGDLGGGGGGGAAAGLYNVSVTLPPVDQGAQKALIDTNGYVRNAVRLVAVHNTIVGQICPEANRTYETVCDPDDPNDCFTTWTCTGGLVDDYALVAEVVGDGALEADGSGTMGLLVPPGENYTLHVIPYVAGNVAFDIGGNEENDSFTKFTKAQVVAKINSGTGRIVLQNNDRAIIAGHATTPEFDLTPGQSRSLTMTWENPMVELNLPVDPVLAGADYPIQLVSKSVILGDNWYVQQLVSPADESDMLLIRESGISVFSGSSDSIMLDTEITDVTGVGTGGYGVSAPAHTIWHFAQFFISQDMLWPGEASLRWVYGTSYAGGINAYGSVVVN